MSVYEFTTKNINTSVELTYMPFILTFIVSLIIPLSSCRCPTYTPAPNQTLHHFYSILLHLLTFFCSFNPCPLPFNVIFILTSILLLFQVSHIDPGTPIKLYLYAENAKGTSDPAIIDDASLNQQKHYVEGKDMRLQGYHNIKIWECEEMGIWEHGDMKIL